jgi:hypothetical protein
VRADCVGLLLVQETHLHHEFDHRTVAPDRVRVDEGDGGANVMAGIALAVGAQHPPVGRLRLRGERHWESRQNGAQEHDSHG